MAKVKFLKNNQDENRFSNDLEKFLRRQLHLKGNLSVIQHLDTKWNVSMGIPLRIIDGPSVLFEEMYRFFPYDEQQLPLIKAYLYNILLSQCVENFETYLKNIFGSILDSKLECQISQQLNRRAFGNNSEIIKLIKFYLSPIDISIELARILPIFLLLEQVRHVTTHSDQIIKDQNWIQSSPFNDYFTTQTTKGETRIIIDYKKAEILNSEISQLGFEFFNLLSEKHSYPIKIN